MKTRRTISSGGAAALALSLLAPTAYAQLPRPTGVTVTTSSPAVQVHQTAQRGAQTTMTVATTTKTRITPIHAARRPKPQQRAPLARGGALSTVRDANDKARSGPTRAAYLNAALYYDFEPGRLYTVHTSPRFLTAIALRPGETIISKAAGDTVRWIMGETETGSGATKQQLVMIKPLRGGLRTNVIITTDQHTYLLDAVSHEQDFYTTEISWNYPLDQFREMQAAKVAAAAAAQAQQASVVGGVLAINNLHFGYKIKSERGHPRWQPVRVFDDGSKTYVQFPVNLASSEAPPMFLIGPHDTAQLVNYRFVNGYYVVDRLFDVAELRLGEKPQNVVRITREGARG